MRNTLTLVKGLVGEGRRHLRDVDAFAAKLESWVAALSQAQGHLTAIASGWVDLRRVLEQELSAYATPAGPTVTISGDHVELSPPAFQSLALILHELTANSAAQGALSTAGGRLDISVTMSRDGHCDLNWREAGAPDDPGPAATHVLGLTVIDEALSDELQGTTEIDVGEDGRNVRLRLSPGLVNQRAAARPAPERGRALQDIEIGGAALILSDRLIASMEAKGWLEEAGATEVHLCASATAAIEALTSETFAVALIDLHLGRDTSHVVAERVIAASVPVVFLSDDAPHASTVTAFATSAILQTPLTPDDLRGVLGDLFAHQNA